jgi:hypothetical protein
MVGEGRRGLLLERKGSAMLKKLWAAAAVLLLCWVSIESEQVYAKSYLTDEIGEGSVFHLDPHLQSLKAGSDLYFQDGHTMVMTDLDPVKPYCVLKFNRKPAELADGNFIVHFANAASPHWFFNDKSELECRRVETEEDLNAAVQGLVSIEKHRESRNISSELSKN